MRPGRYAGHNKRIMIFAIDKQPVAVYVAFAASLELAVKRVVPARGRELGVDAQKRNQLLHFWRRRVPEVFLLFTHP